MLNLIPAPRGSVHMQEGSVKLRETVTVSHRGALRHLLQDWTATWRPQKTGLSR